jgi:hypothetical protein
MSKPKQEFDILRDLDGEKLTQELDAMLDAAMPEIERTFQDLDKMDLDNRPMRERHAEMGRLLQQAGTKYLNHRGRKCA